MRRAAATVCSLVMAGVLLAGGTLAALPGQSAAQKLAAGENVWGSVTKAASMVWDLVRIVAGLENPQDHGVLKPANPAKTSLKPSKTAKQTEQTTPKAGGKTASGKLGTGMANVRSGDEAGRVVEQAVLREINRVRREQHLMVLEWNDGVTELARLKAAEALETGVVSHDSPTYGTVDQMCEKANIGFRIVGEVIYVTDQPVEQTEEIAAKSVDGWLNSPPHRRVVLGQEYKEVGIGVAWTRDAVPAGKAWIRVSVFAIALDPKEPSSSPTFSDFPSTRDIIKEPGGR